MDEKLSLSDSQPSHNALGFLGWPRQTVAAFLSGLLLGAILSFGSNWYVAQRVHDQCSTPALPGIIDADSQENLESVRKELDGCKRALASRGACPDCKAETERALQSASRKWDAELTKMEKLRTDALQKKAEAEAREMSAEKRCRTHVEVVSNAESTKARRDAEAACEEAKLVCQADNAQLRDAIQEEKKLTRVATRDRDIASAAHRQCQADLQRAAEAHENGEQAHKDDQVQLADAVNALRSSAGECEARHRTTHDALCYICHACSKAVSIPACEPCKGHHM